VRSSRVATLSPFYGYPPELIAAWCGVSVPTARRWKRGVAAPRPALRLFTLYRDGKVLDQHWEGWRTHKGTLTDPDGNSTTQGQLRAYWAVLQLGADLARRDPEAAERWWELLKRA
jgi:hypothetical protein